MPDLDSLQQYVEVGILVISLLVLVPAGWFTGGASTKMMGVVFAKHVSARAVYGSRATGGLIGAVLAVLLWGGFGGRGVPGPGGKGYPNTKRDDGTPSTLLDKTLPATAPAQPVASVPPAITTDGQHRQVRIAVLGKGTQPRYAQDNRFFILLDGPDKEPRTTEKLVADLEEWRNKHQVEHVILHYALKSADPDNPEVQKLRKAVEGQRMQFTTKYEESGKWVP
jgi:hypothetical protein